MRGLTNLDPETGAGNPGPEWAVAAHGVEVDFNTRECTYRIRKAVTVMDIGEVLNFKAAVGQVKGAMSMGLSWAAREAFYFDKNGRILNPQLRTYRPIRFGEHPEYIADFVKTPHLEAPFGARGAGEHGLIGIPAALANALSLAAGVELVRLPLIPEEIWRTKRRLPKMIFDYFRPERLLEATEYFTERRKEGGIPLFFGGGTEIITMQRLHEITLDTAIDIKAIDAVNIHDIVEGYVAIGAAVTLTEIQNKNLFPLLTEVSKEVADRTARNKITLGGNICGNIFIGKLYFPFF